MAIGQNFQGKFNQLVSDTCMAGTNPPNFAGVTTVTANNDGSFTVNWAVATGGTGITAPFRYKVYVALGASVAPATLFVSANIAGESATAWIKMNIFQLGDQSTYFVNGRTYTIGVRAFSAENVTDTNTVTVNSTAVATGNIGGAFQATETSFAATELLLQADHVNFQTDHANFQTDHTNFGTDLSTFNTYLSALNGYLSILASDLTTLGSLNTSIASSASSLSSSASSLAASATSIASTESALATDVAQFGTDLVTFGDDLTTFATQLATLTSTNTTLATNTAAIGAAATKVNNAANLILATVI